MPQTMLFVGSPPLSLVGTSVVRLSVACSQPAGDTRTPIRPLRMDVSRG